MWKLLRVSVKCDVSGVLSLIYVGDESGRNDLKETGGVETFVC